MVFGSSTWRRSEVTTAPEVMQVKTSCVKTAAATAEDGWFVLRESESLEVGGDDVVLSSSSLLTEHCFELIGNDSSAVTDTVKTRVKEDVRNDQVENSDEFPFLTLKTVEQLLFKNGRLMLAPEKWKVIIVLLICSLIAKQATFFWSKKQEGGMHIPVPFVPQYENFSTSVYQFNGCHSQPGDGNVEPVTRPPVYDVSESTMQPFRSFNDNTSTPPADTAVRSTMRDFPEKKVPVLSSGSVNLLKADKSHLPPKASDMTLWDFDGMKRGKDWRKAKNRTLFIIPAPLPCPVQNAVREQSSHTEFAIGSLGRRIAELQTKNEEYIDQLTRMAIETSNWRSRTVACGHELEKIKKFYEALLTVAQSQAESIPVPSVLSPSHDGLSEIPLATNISTECDYNASGSIKPNSSLSSSVPSERSAGRVGPTALIPSPP